MVGRSAGLVVFFALAMGGCMSASEKAGSKSSNAGFGVAGVRYQVTDVERSIAFYTTHLGFKLEQRLGPAFGRVSIGGLDLWLSGPKSSGARPMPDGRKQEPGGWNRIALKVDNLEAVVEKLKGAGVRFRNQIEVGPGGKQVQIEDPDGNPIELFEPAS
jgi:glyoxylase I family protein